MAEKKQCYRCGKEVAHTKTGSPYTHKDPVTGRPCVPVVVSEAAPTVEPQDDKAEEDMNDADKGAWFGAMYDGKCSVNECRIYEGDRIRADGKGGYECEDCGAFDDAMDRHVKTSLTWTPARNACDCFCGRPLAIGDLTRHVGDEESVYFVCQDCDGEPLGTPASGPMLTAEEFLTDLVPDATPARGNCMPTAEEFLSEPVPDVRLNVSGQPTDESKFRDYLGRYAIKDPATGEFRRFKNGKVQGITRMTTFNKAAGNSKAINDWNRRNIVIGAALRGDLVIKARGMTHEANREELDRLAGEFEVAAGSKIASSIGTDVHEITERIDAGVLRVEDAPVQYRDQLALYVKALADAGLEPVPGMIERVTAFTEYGGVAGTFDRLYYHRPSGRYLVGDVKTGKTMKYAMSETECQEWGYAHGVNQNGVYDLNTHEWEQPHTPDNLHERLVVDETEGIVIHMPVQGPLAGTVRLLRADLVRGRAYAELCADVRGWEPSKEVLWTWEPAERSDAPLNASPDAVWDAMFANVRSGEEATALWRRAKEDGITGVRLNELIEIARDVLRSKG